MKSFRRMTLSLVVLCVLLTVAPVLSTMAQTITKRVLMLSGNVVQTEWNTIPNEVKVSGDYTFEYEQTRDRNIPGAADFDILWIGQGEICENGTLFNADILSTEAPEHCSPDRPRPIPALTRENGRPVGLLDLADPILPALQRSRRQPV